MEITHALVNIDAVDPHPGNYRRHPEGQIERIKASLRRFGQVRSVVLQSQEDSVRYTIVAGHGLIQGMQEMGKAIVSADIIPADWPPAKVKAYLIADNRTADLAEDDNEQLSALLSEIREYDPELIESAGYTSDEADKIARIALSKMEPDPAEEPQEEPRPDLLQKKWKTETGQLWAIPSLSFPDGDHYLIIGDCTDRAVVDRIMHGDCAELLIADPPYNVGKDFTGEKQTADEYIEFSERWFSVWQEYSKRQIITPGYVNLATWIAGTLPQPYHVAPWIKTNSGTWGYTSTFLQWEPIVIYGEPDEWSWEGILFYGPGWSRERATDIFDYPVGLQKHGDGHPDPKPARLWADFMLSYASEGARVVDPFGGSGTALRAAESSRRLASLVEIEPRYAAMILETAKMEGLEPEIVE